MQFLHVKSSLCLSALASALIAAQTLAQEPVGNEESDQSSQSRRLHYIDQPVQLEPGVDPAMPLPPAQPVSEDDPQFILRMNSIRQYSTQVEEIESRGGVWDGGLIEELSALGNLQQQQGDHLAAIPTFNRAIHVNRINTGLHTLDQIPAVEQIIDSYIALGDWENADLYNNYLFFVQKKAFGANDPRIIPVLNRLAKWNIQAFNVGYGESMGVRLSTAQILFSAAARMITAHFGPGDERMVDLLHDIASTSYLVTRYPEYMYEVEQPEFRLTQDTLRQQLNQRGAEPRGFRAGEQALLEIVSYYREESDSSYELAEAIAHLADWYLLHDRRGYAGDLYLEAWQLLSAETNGEELNARLFGQVIPIPAFFDQPTKLARNVIDPGEDDALTFDYADIALDVTVNGSVRNVRVLTEETGENGARLSRLQREIRSSRFRPRVVDGQVVRTDDNRFRYRYWY